jgi:acetyl-CoA carboxylase beta subunit
MQELNAEQKRSQRYDYYVTMRVSTESRAVIDEVRKDPLWRHVDLKDLIAFAWPKCPRCGGPLAVKLMSQNVVCVRCRTEYSLTPAT